jgi:antitoxin MazE
MEVIVKKWGNNLGIKIPDLIIRELSLKEGSFVDIRNKRKEIIIASKRKKALSEMLTQINEENIHNEVETNSPTGNEIW